MPVSTETNRTTLVGNGVTTNIPVSFPFHAAGDLVVIETVIATGVQATKVITTHYTVTGTADAYGHYPNGGTVVANTAPASTVRWTVYRDPAATQNVDPTQNDPLPVDTALESPLDRLTMIAVRLKERITRSLRQPEGDSADIDFLPSKIDRASKYLTFDAEGDPTAAAAPANTTAVSAFMATVLDDTTAAVARATLQMLVHAISTKTATYAVVVADNGTLIDCTSGTFDVDLPAAATAGAGFVLTVKNSGTGIITIDPDSTELINGISGLVLLPEDEALIVSDGAAWKSFARFQNAVPIANDFRLSLTTALPVTTADVTAAGTLYAVPKTGNRISLYNGAKWIPYTSAEFSLALTLTSGKPYDVFCYQNAGVPTLETLVWTDDTTRATALTRQNGVLVKTGDATRRYLGTLYASGTNTTEDSLAKRYLWNYYHRVHRPMRVVESTSSWTYTTAVWRQANAAVANQLDFIIGVAEDMVSALVVECSSNTTGSIDRNVGIGLDSTSVNSSSIATTASPVQTANNTTVDLALYTAIIAAGRHTLVWLERSIATTTTTWRGVIGAGGVYGQSGISGDLWA